MPRTRGMLIRPTGRRSLLSVKVRHDSEICADQKKRAMSARGPFETCRDDLRWSACRGQCGHGADIVEAPLLDPKRLCVARKFCGANRPLNPISPVIISCSDGLS